MAGSTYGKNFRITTFGESHGKALGVIIDGCPAGLPLNEDDIMPFLNRRKPGQSAMATARKENDQVQILSGVFEGKTTGTPIAMVTFNESQKSHDYNNIMNVFRPGHADYSFHKKYGFRDYRGGGRSSGRETFSRVAAGAVAIKILKEMGIDVLAYTKSIGDITIDYDKFDANEILNNPVYMPDKDAADKATTLVSKCKEDLDSVGGCVEIKINGVPAGLGEPVFDKLDADLSKALFSIGAVKAVEVGDGIQVARANGSANNDAFAVNDGKVITKTNHAGGILGGISNGQEIILRAYFKPTPSIYREQQTIDVNMNETTIAIEGRHDPIVVPRAVVVTEAMCALTILDALMENATAKLSNLKKIYE